MKTYSNDQEELDIMFENGYKMVRNFAIIALLLALLNFIL